MYAAHAEGHGLARDLLGRDGRGERRRLLRAFESGFASRAPRDRVAAAVRDRDRRIVERRVDVGDALGLDDALRFLCGCHYLVTFFLPAIARRGPFFVRAFVWVR